MSNKLKVKLEKPRKEILKGPDEFQQYVAKAADFFKVYGTKIMIAVGVTLAVIVTIVIVTRVNDASHVHTSAEFQDHFDKVTAQVLPNAKLDKLPVPDKQALEQTRQDLAAFVKENEGNDIAGMATVGQGIAALQAGDAAGAAEILKPLLDNEDIDSAIMTVVLHAYATAANMAGLRDEAVATYEKIAAGNGVMTSAYVYMSLGDMYNPNIAGDDDKSADVARSREYYDKGSKALATENGMEALVLQNTLKARIAGLN